MRLLISYWHFQRIKTIFLRAYNSGKFRANIGLLQHSRAADLPLGVRGHACECAPLHPPRYWGWDDRFLLPQVLYDCRFVPVGSRLGAR